VLAVDVGGTKLAVGVVDSGGGVQWSQQGPTPAGDADTIRGALDRLIKAVPAHFPLQACGIGCGGPMSPGGELVSPLNIPGWRDYPLRATVSAATGLPTWIDNDAKALALADGWVGDAAGMRNYLSMVVSTGVGGGLVVDGRLLDGAAGNAGHIGHVIVEPGGRRCSCGAVGCLEAEASGTAILAMTGRPAADAGPEVIARTGRMVGRAVATVANLLDLPLACVAGSVALGFGAPFFEAAQGELSERARLSFSSVCRIVPSRLGTAGPLIGAAAVAWRHLSEGAASA
jgi:glucokinase